MIFAKPARGSGGAGMSGILQGMIAGQQSNESEQRMEWLQANQDRQTDEFEKKDFNERMYNIREVQKSGGNIAPQLTKLNEWKAETKNFSDGDDFRLGNWNEFRDDTGVFPRSFENKYKTDTGKDFVQGTSDAKDPMMLGDQIFDFDTFESGAANFQSYAKDRDQMKLLQDAQIAKAMGAPKGPSDMDQYLALKDNKTRSEQQENKYKVLQKKLKMTEDANIDKLTYDFGSSLEKAQGGDIVSNDVVNNAVNAQAKAKQTYTKRDERAKSVAGSKRMVDTYKDLGNLTKKYDTGDGWAKGIETEILKNSSQEEFAAMDEEAQIRTTANAIKQTTVFSKVFEVIKEQSGAAFTDEEFARRLATIVGGDPTKINEQTLMTAFGTYTAESLKNTKADLNEISNLYMGDKLSLTNSFNKGTESFVAPTPTTFATKPKDGVPAADVAKEVGRQQAEEITKTITNVGQGIVEGLWGGGKDAIGFNTDLRGEDRDENLQKSFRNLEKASKEQLLEWWNRYGKSLSADEKAAFKKQFVR